MSVVAIIVIAVVVVALLVALFVFLPRMREQARIKARERELGQRREHVVTQQREAAEQHSSRAEAAEQRARIAAQEAERERAEADLRHERAGLHERGLADEERSWLGEHKDEAPPRQGSYEDFAYIDARRAWQGKLAEAGLAGVAWPKEYGGQGLGPIEQVTVNQEISAAQVPGILDVIGIGMLGPCLIAHGTEPQKSRHLGPMLHGDEVWCQMFSEPAAGSDLAAVQTRARQNDDGTWTLNGQKVWTTNAQFASFGLLLARTDPDVPKHKGLTMFIVPMDAEGVTVRGLRQISGEAEFNEVFFDDVKLTDEHVVGGVGNGWTTALTVLMHERLTIGFGSESFGSPTRLAETIANDQVAHRDADVRKRLGDIITEMTAVRFGGYRALTQLQRGQIPG